MVELDVVELDVVELDVVELDVVELDVGPDFNVRTSSADLKFSETGIQKKQDST